LADADVDALSSIADMVFDKEDIVKNWRRETFKSNKSFMDGLIHTTTLGLRVRSKSEAIIAGILEANCIPFRYESALILGGKTYYPDFTVLSPTSGKIFYWEHFGMLNDRKYKESAKEKLILYFEHGLFPCDNLILTYDKEDGSIDASVIQKYIDINVFK